MNAVLSALEKKVKEKLHSEGTGHDWQHIHRVNEIAAVLAKEEEADEFIVSAAALLHDLADDKVVGNEKEGMKEITRWLKELQVEQEMIDHIIEIIQTISFKGGGTPTVRTLEAKVVQDADRLDAMGAIGIARCFTYAGSKGHLIYDPSVPVRDTMTQKEYRNQPSPAINHFYEKLLKLKDLMNTSSGMKEAQKRHDFMTLFLEEFYREVNGA